MITGASAGVGRALVREYAKHKAKVGLIARDPERLEAAKAAAAAGAFLWKKNA